MTTQESAVLEPKAAATEKQWDDILLRDSIGDTGKYPTGGTLSDSPDIIPYGTSPIQDPSTFVDKTNWSKELGKNLTAKATNYLYVRGQNLAKKAQTGEMYLYHSKASLLLYPDQWRDNGLKTSDGADHVEVSAAKSGDKVVTANPFTWVPEMISGDHYCLVARVATPDQPADIPQKTGDIQSFAKFISERPNFAWRNIAVVNSGSATWTTTVEYDQGTIKSPIQFLITCKNVPVGAEVGFSAGTPGPKPVVDLPKTKVTNSKSFVVGMAAQVPANWSTNISYSYFANGHNPLPGFSIEMSAVYIVPGDNELFERAATAENLGLPPNLTAAIGPRRGIRVGAHTTVTDAG